MRPDQLTLFDPEAAQLNRDAGIRRVLEAADVDFRQELETAIEQLARSGEPFTADDVRRIIGPVPAGQHFNIIGAVFSAAAHRGTIELIGYTKSASVIGHGNLIRRWRGKP